jgi:hypothetical protein
MALLMLDDFLLDLQDMHFVSTILGILTQTRQHQDSAFMEKQQLNDGV